MWYVQSGRVMGQRGPWRAIDVESWGGPWTEGDMRPRVEAGHGSSGVLMYDDVEWYRATLHFYFRECKG